MEIISFLDLKVKKKKKSSYAFRKMLHVNEIHLLTAWFS